MGVAWKPYLDADWVWFHMKWVWSLMPPIMQQSVESKSRELSLLKDSSLSEKRKNLERMSTLFRDLHDVSSILGTDMEDKLKHLDDTTNSELSDEDFTKGRIHLSNLRSEVRTLAKQREVLETAEKKAREKAQCAAVELGSYKTKMAQVFCILFVGNA